MSGDDDIPDYLKGVDQPGFGDERDNFTVRTGAEGPLHRAGFNKHADDEDDDDDDEVEERPPIQIPWPLIIAAVVLVGMLGTLFAAGVAATGTWINDAERASLAEAGEIAKAVDEERKILDELGARGADRDRLVKLYSEIESREGHERGIAALAFTTAVDNEVASIGDIRGTKVADRHKKLAFAQKSYEDSLVAWDSAAGNPIGRVAVMVGLASDPPEHPSIR